MKKLLKKYLLNLFTLWLLASVLGIITVTDQALLLAALVLSICQLFLLPILKLLFVPINMLTLGLLSWVPHTFLLYLTHLLTPNFNIDPYTSPMLQIFSITIPSLKFGLISTFVFTTITYTLIRKLITSVFRSES